MEGMWAYLSFTVVAVMAAVFVAFRSVMVPIRLGFALLLTLGITYGTGVLVYQTPLLHGIIPSLSHFHGIAYEVVPLITGTAIALGLDYDIFLVSRIYEFRKKGFTDRASVFRRAAKTSGIISGA